MTLLSSSSLLLVLFFLSHFSICNALMEPSVLSKTALKHCTGSIGECLSDQPEMESDISRRVLMMQPHKRYIRYETLKRDIVPCTRPGASYYSCDAGQANPYTRGCEVIAGCRTSLDINY